MHLVHYRGVQDGLLEPMELGVVLAAVKAATILFTVVPGPAGMAYIIHNIILSMYSANSTRYGLYYIHNTMLNMITNYET